VQDVAATSNCVPDDLLAGLSVAENHFDACFAPVRTSGGLFGMGGQLFPRRLPSAKPLLKVLDGSPEGG